jgi:hypothetical protein
MVSSGMLCCVALVRTDVSEKLSASIVRVTRIGELGKTLSGSYKSQRPNILKNAILQQILHCIICRNKTVSSIENSKRISTYL